MWQWTPYDSTAEAGPEKYHIPYMQRFEGDVRHSLHVHGHMAQARTGSHGAAAQGVQWAGLTSYQFWHALN